MRGTPLVGASAPAADQLDTPLAGRFSASYGSSKPAGSDFCRPCTHNTGK
jgi:hypothetical protein